MKVEERREAHNVFGVMIIYTKLAEKLVQELWDYMAAKQQLGDKRINTTFKFKLLELKDSLRSFNKMIEPQLADKEAHKQVVSSIDKLNDLLANATEEQGTKMLLVIEQMVKNAEILEDKGEIGSAVSLIGEITGKLYELDIKQIQSFHKRVMNLKK